MHQKDNLRRVKASQKWRYTLFSQQSEMVVHSFNPNIQEAEAKPNQHSKFQAIRATF